MSTRLFVSGTGTAVGKTWVSRGLAASGRRRGLRVAAIKPYETGCDPEARDAVALARAAGRPELASATGLYRARAPLAPWAATLGGEPPPPAIEALVREIGVRAAEAELVIVEGAGGLCVPVDETHDVAELAVALGAPLLLVAGDALGVLSHTLTAAEAAAHRGLALSAIVLTPVGSTASDDSPARNRSILEARLRVPVVAFPETLDDDGALADAAEASGLYRVVTRTPRSQ